MDREELRTRQAGLKQAYREEPATGLDPRLCPSDVRRARHHGHRGRLGRTRACGLRPGHGR